MYKSRLMLGATILSLVPALAVQAQTNDAPAVLEEIIVTAQKRAERLIDVPLAVTAVGGDTLENLRINDSNSLTNAIPSLTFQQGANPTNTNFRIRGIGTQLFGQGTEASVSVVVDGVVSARGAQGFAELADIERVEVLRGPQGTLFGKNATAGVINVVTARPSDEFGGRAEVTIAEGNEYRAKSTITGPLSDTVRGRLSGYYTNVDGHVRNVTTGKDVQGSEGWGARGKLEWDASDNLNVLFSADYRKQDAMCCASVPIQLSNATMVSINAPVVASRTNRQISENTETYANTEQFTGSIQADWDIDFATITSISAFQKFNLDNNQPIDRTNSSPIRFLGGPSVAPYSAWDFNAGEVRLKQFSEELRIASNGSGDFTYVAGLFYNHIDITRPFNRRRASCVQNAAGQTPLAVGAACPTANQRWQSSGTESNLKQDGVAAFGQAEWRIIGGLKAIGGLRVQYERGENSGTQFGPLVVGDAILAGTTYRPGGANSGSFVASDWATTGKAGLQYEFDRNFQTYGSYTRGYKGLGYEMEAGADFVNQSALEPEHANAYELGAKYVTDDRVFSVNAAAFLTEFSNLQVQANRGDPTLGIVRFQSINAGSSRTKGLELETTLRPTDELSINTSLTYAKSTVNVDGLNCPVQFQAGAPVVPSTSAVPYNTCVRRTAGGTAFQNLQGATLPSSPKYRVVVSPRYERDIGTDLAGFVQMNVSYQSAINFTIEQDPLTRQGGYALVDLTVGVHEIDDRWTVSLFVKNLFDKNYFTSIGHVSLLSSVATTDLVGTFNKDADRYFGGSVGMRF